MIRLFDGRDVGIGSSERRIQTLTVLAGAFLGAVCFVYLAATYQRGYGPPTFWKTLAGWVVLGTPVAIVVGGAMCVFPVARRLGIRVLLASLGSRSGSPVLSSLWW